MIDCLERNGPITRYLVSYRGLQDSAMIKKEQVTNLSFTAVGLQPRTDYNFTVKGLHLMSNISEPSPPATIVASTSVPQGKDV